MKAALNPRPPNILDRLHLQQRTYQPNGTGSFAETIKPMAMAALERLLKGEEIIKIKKQDIVRKGMLTGRQKISITQSQRLPDIKAVVFVMERLFPERLGKRQLQIPEIETCFQPIPEHKESRNISNNDKEEIKDDYQWSVYVSPRIKSLRDRERNYPKPILKVL